MSQRIRIFHKTYPNPHHELLPAFTLPHDGGCFVSGYNEMSDTISREVPYFMVSNKVVDSDELENIYEKMCYVVMCRYTNNGQTAFPSYQTIAKGMGVSRNTAIKTIKTLIEKGFISMENKFKGKVQKTNHYKINELSGGVNEEGVVQEVHPGSAGDALGWCTGRTGVVHEVGTEEEQYKKNKPKNNKSKNNKNGFISEEITTNKNEVEDYEW